MNDDAIFDDYAATATAEGLANVGANAGGESRDFYKLTAGTHALRLLPRKRGQTTDVPWVPRAVRWLRYGNTKLSVPDRRALLDDPEAVCPVTQLVEMFRASGEAAYIAIAEEAKPKYSFVGAVLPCPNNAPIDARSIGAAIRLIEIGGGVYRDILKTFNDPMLMGHTLYHPKDGFPLAITRTGEGMKTEYNVQAYPHLRGFIGGSRESAIEAVKALPDLDKLAAVPSVEHCQRLVDEFMAAISTAASQPQGAGTRNAGTAMAAAAVGAGMNFQR